MPPTWHYHRSRSPTPTASVVPFGRLSTLDVARVALSEVEGRRPEHGLRAAAVGSYAGGHGGDGDRRNERRMQLTELGRSHFAIPLIRR